ncbi:TetR family transcriptional regulator [Afipia sp. P52-10]|jgi:TetR/AcrR family transcriptional repressor of nem operon|uniref:TetR/AcrR family transcriptional regulator n=1 Tax=Afipia sp. P52-10 TaxID=1429916 RepID=UPI0003DF1581|nr:TetR/AcrR family transcriptional regulator [Afipia sp. P52-10]ETR77048.1 TetR family transcriptional regulator [Afipia sp. P52-10]
MRYGKDHKEETHKRVVEAAARRFRKDGIGSTGVVDLMADAGLTHGGFYAHFASKETLVKEALVAASIKSRAHLQMQIDEARATGRDPLEAIVRSYLTIGHRDRPERGCCVAALGSEIARHPRKTREAFTEGLEKTFGIIAGTLPDRVPNRKERACAIFSILVGALQISRAISDSATSQTVLDAAVAAALQIGRCTEA